MGRDRRAWLFPGAGGDHRGIDLAPLDPADEADRTLLIEAEHPELADALAAGRDEIELDGEAISPRMHILLHEAVASQVWGDEPPVVWATAERLLDAGYERHEVLHMLASAVAHELWSMRAEGKPFDVERHAASLAALPEIWERARPSAASLPEGTTVTHRLSAAERDGGHLEVAPDLAVIEAVAAGDDLLLTAGGVLTTDGATLLGPSGWLGDLAAGDLVGLRSVGGAVKVVVRPDPVAPELLGDRLRVAFDAANEGDGMPVPVAELVGAALELEPALDEVVLPPLTDWLEACEFEHRDGWLAPVGTDWVRFDQVGTIVAVAEEHGLGADDIEPLVTLLDVYELMVEHPEEEGSGPPLPGAAEVLGDAGVAQAFVTLALGDPTDEVAAGGLRRFLDRVLRTARRLHRPGPAWAGALVAERVGDHERAEALLREALDADPQHPPSLEHQAWYASDRGDARRAFDLLTRAEVEDDGRLDVLGRIARPPEPARGPERPVPVRLGPQAQAVLPAGRGHPAAVGAGRLGVGEAPLVPHRHQPPPPGGRPHGPLRC